jgi:hypothetical protein
MNIPLILGFILLFSEFLFESINAGLALDQTRRTGRGERESC